jgi:hypothetical protein
MTVSGELTETIPIQLEDGTTFRIEVVPQGKMDIGFGAMSFDSVAQSIEGVLKAIAEPVRKARPTKATVKFGIEIQIQQGSLVAAIVRGTGKSNLEITMEWEHKPALTASSAPPSSSVTAALQSSSAA